MKIENLKLKIVFFGTPAFVVPVLDNLSKHFHLVGVVTAPDTEQGRKKILTPSPVKIFAKEHGITVLQPDTPDNKLLEDLKKIDADIFVVAAYGKILPQSTIELPPLGSLNIHPSLLPLYRGPSPIQTALLNGDTTTGISIIKMDEKMDHGPIIKQWEVSIKKDDTFEKLHFSLFKDAAQQLPGIIIDYRDGKLTPIPQDDSKATFCAMITRESGRFDSDNPPTPEELDRMIRAYYPWPNAWTIVRIKNQELRIKFLPEQRIQVEGGKPMSVKDIINGHPELKELITGLLGEK